MPAFVPIIIEVIQGIIKYSPDIVKAVAQVKNLIAALFSGKVIDAATQDYLMQQSDAFLAGFEAGRVPPAWTVEPDPGDADDTAAVIDEGVVIGKTDPPAALPPGVTADEVVVKLLPDPNGDPARRWFCNYQGNCWSVLLAEFTKTPLGTGQLWTNTAGLKFYLPDDILAGLNA